MSLFSSIFGEKEVEKLKEIPIPEATKSVSKELTLYNISLQYNRGFSNNRKFRATVIYRENPDDPLNPGISNEDEILGKSWKELIDNVSEYMEKEIK